MFGAHGNKENHMMQGNYGNQGTHGKKGNMVTLD
jgi:hypothetical protein